MVMKNLAGKKLVSIITGRPWENNEMPISQPTVSLSNPVPSTRWFRILPPCVIIYIIAYMDRVNIGFAMAAGMNKDLGISSTYAGLAAGIFFWGYLLLQIPGGHIAEHGSPKKFIASTILAWGAISFLTGFVQTGWELYVMRFLLGVAEGGVYPAILVVVGKWFPRTEIGRANALFLISLPLSAVLTNPISGFVVDQYGWRALFYFEGVVSLVLLLIWWPLASDDPTKAKWISTAERDYIQAALAQDRASKEEEFARTDRSTKGTYRQLLLDKNLWIMSIIFICFLTGSYGFLIWLPTLLKELMKASLSSVGWLSVLPLTAAVIGLYSFGALSDRKGNRRGWCAIALCGFGIAFGLAAFIPHLRWISFALIVVTGLLSKAIAGPYWSMPDLLFPPGVAGGARGIINGIGNLGGFIGPVLFGWLTTLTGTTSAGIYALAAILVLGGLVCRFLPETTGGGNSRETS